MWHLHKQNSFYLVFIIDYICCFSGENMVPKPPFQVQEAVEKWRNPSRATCCFQPVSPLQLSTNYCLGLSTESKNEQCQLQFTSEQQPSEHNCAYLFGKLLLVLNNEFYNTSATPTSSTPPQRCPERWDDILKQLTLKKGQYW